MFFLMYAWVAHCHCVLVVRWCLGLDGGSSKVPTVARGTYLDVKLWQYSSLGMGCRSLSNLKCQQYGPLAKHSRMSFTYALKLSTNMALLRLH
jgi:hypothetical protein